jgi:hypothetical protein
MLALGLAIFAIGADAPPATGPTSAPATAPATQAAATSQPALTLITMHMKAQPKDAFDELAKQSGVKFVTANGLWDQDSMQDELQIDLDKRPFWSALNELCGVCNVAPQSANNFNGYGNTSNSRRLTLFQTGAGRAGKPRLPTFESGGFMVQAVSFNRQQNVSYASPQPTQDFSNVQIMVYVDPAIRVSNFSQNIKATEAVDDKGQSMLLDNDAVGMSYGGFRGSSLIFPATIGLKYPANPGKKIASLKFTVQLRGSTEVETISVDKPLDANEVTKDFGGSTITFHSLKKSSRAGFYELKIGFMSDGDQLNSDPLNMIQSAQLLDSRGHAFYATPGGGSSGNGTAEYTINYSSTINGMVRGGEDAASGQPAKWVLEIPIKSHAIKLPVEFKDLPLP